MHPIRFDDIEALAALISEDYGPWGPPVGVGQAMIDGFAELTGDRQWIHVDVDRARRESPFGQPIAHGLLVLSITPLLAIPGVTVNGQGSAANYGIDKLRFVSPVPAGSSVHGRSRLAGVDAHRRGTLLRTIVEVAVVAADRPSLVFERQALFLPPAP